MKSAVMVGAVVMLLTCGTALPGSPEPGSQAGSISRPLAVEIPTLADGFGPAAFQEPLSNQHLPEYDPGRVAGDTLVLDHKPVLEALARFEAQHGHYLAKDLRERLHAPLSLYHNSTLVGAQEILRAEEIPAKERLYELDLFLRAHDGEWTLGTAGRYATTWALDNLKDAWIADVVTVYAPHIGVPLKLIMQANSVFSFLPGFKGGYGDDLIAYMEKEQDTERYRRVHAFLNECRTLSPDEIRRKISEHRARIDAINVELSGIPAQLRKTVLAELPSSVEQLMPELNRELFWNYVSGEPLPPGVRAAIESRVGKTPHWRNWVSSANQHFGDAWRESLALVREQAMLQQMNHAAVVGLESKEGRVAEGADARHGVSSADRASARPSARGHWFASSLPADWQVVRNEKGAWTATVRRVIAAKSGNCPEQGAHGSVSVELKGSSSSRDRNELESGLHKLLKSSGWYLEPDAMAPYALTGPGGEAFAGRILHSKLKYTAGFGSPTVGYRSGRANIGGYVAAIEPDRGRKITAVYSVSAAHCWDNSGADGAKAQAQAMRGQAVQILQNLVLLADKSDSVAVAGPPAGSPGSGVTQPAPVAQQPAVVGSAATAPGGQSTPGQGVSVSPPNPQSITVAGDGAQPGGVSQAGSDVQSGAGKAQPSTQPEPSARAGWHLVDFTFKDGSSKRSSGQFDDIVSHTGGRGDLEITSKRVVRSSGNLIGEVVYRVRWSEPPEVLEAGQQYAIDFELQTLRADKFKVAQQTIHMNQGHGVYLVAPDGTKYVTTDLKAPFKMEKAVAAGRPGNKRTLQLSFQSGYWAIYTYEWKETAGR